MAPVQAKIPAPVRAPAPVLGEKSLGQSPARSDDVTSAREPRPAMNFTVVWTALILASTRFTNLWGSGPVGEDGMVLMVGLWLVPCVGAHLIKVMMDNRR